MQIWPWCRKEPQAPAETARSRSASSRIDQGRVAAQFQVHPLEVAGGQLAHRAAGRGRAGEGDDPDPRIGDQRLARPRRRRAATCSSPSGRPASSKMRAWMKPPASGVRDVRLDHDRVAERERRRDRAGGRISGTLNGEITPTTPTGDPAQQAQPRLVGRQDLAERAARPARPPRSTPGRRRRPRTRPGRRWHRSPGLTQRWISAAFWPMRSPARRSTAARSSKLVAAHAFWAAAAVAAARATSSGSAGAGPAQLAHRWPARRRACRRRARRPTLHCRSAPARRRSRATS